MKRIIRFTAIALLAAILLACNGAGTNNKSTDVQLDSAKASISSWMTKHANDYPGYKPIEFGKLTPRYERNSYTYLLICNIEEEKTSATPNRAKIDSLQRTLHSFKNYFLGYTILHKYSTEGQYGDYRTFENLFFLDSNFNIITVLGPDAYDQIMDEKLMFRPETPDSL